MAHRTGRSDGQEYSETVVGGSVSSHFIQNDLNACGDPDRGNFSVARISHCRLSRDREHSRGRWQLTGTDDFVQVWGKFETRYLNQESHQRL